jgi:hypothetical protein
MRRTGSGSTSRICDTLARNPYERVRLTSEALEDLDAILDRSIGALRAVFPQLRRLDRGEIVPTPLQDYAKTGDPADCGKIVVGVDEGPEYRIVVRSSNGHHDVVEVVVVEARTDDLAYLLAGWRLGRITDPIRRSDTQSRVARIRQRLTPP